MKRQELSYKFSKCKLEKKESKTFSHFPRATNTFSDSSASFSLYKSRLLTSSARITLYRVNDGHAKFNLCMQVEEIQSILHTLVSSKRKRIEEKRYLYSMHKAPVYCWGFYNTDGDLAQRVLCHRIERRRTEGLKARVIYVHECRSLARWLIKAALPLTGAKW